MLTARLSVFLLFAALVAAAPQTSVPKSGKSPAPKLPVVDFDACGSRNPGIYSGEPLPFELEADDRLYSSWQDSHVLVRSLPRGTKVTTIGAVNIIREPDRGVITGEVDQSLRPLARGTRFSAMACTLTVWYPSGAKASGSPNTRTILRLKTPAASLIRVGATSISQNPACKNGGCS